MKNNILSLIGKQFGNFLVTKLLGSGGMGNVYLAEHPHIDSKIAIKVLHKHLTANPEVATRFFKEAKAVNKIRHHNVINIYDFGQLEDGRLYFTMEYLEGVELTDKISVGNLELAEITDIFSQICDGIASAHKLDIVHRDLKPENIFLTKEEGHFKVTILDFGVAKLLDFKQGKYNKTKTGLIIGTPNYMSPEQAAGKIDIIGPQSDIYSLAIILYQMYTGSFPYGEEELTALILANHIKAKPIPIYQYNPEIPKEVWSVISKALSKNLSDRYPSILEFKNKFLNASKFIKKKETFYSGFKRGKVVSIGKNSIIYRALKNKTETNFVIKVYKDVFSKKNKFYKDYSSFLKSFSDLNHPNIVKIHNWGVSGKNFYIIMDYIDGKSLKDIFKNELPSKISQFKNNWIKQIKSALLYTSIKSINSFELTLDNILIDKHGNVKLINFRIELYYSYFTENIENIILNNEVIYYLPPEGIKNNFKTIIWQFGILLFYFNTLSFPFKGNDFANIRNNINTKEPDYNKIQNPDERALVKALLTKDSEKRPHNLSEVNLNKTETSNEDAKIPSSPPPSSPPPSSQPPSSPPPIPSGKTQKAKFLSTKSSGKNNKTQTNTQTKKTLTSVSPNTKIFSTIATSLIFSLFIFVIIHSLLYGNSSSENQNETNKHNNASTNQPVVNKKISNCENLYQVKSYCFTKDEEKNLKIINGKKDFIEVCRNYLNNENQLINSLTKYSKQECQKFKKKYMIATDFFNYKRVNCHRIVKKYVNCHVKNYQKTVKKKKIKKWCMEKYNTSNIKIILKHYEDDCTKFKDVVRKYALITVSSIKSKRKLPERKHPKRRKQYTKKKIKQKSSKSTKECQALYNKAIKLKNNANFKNAVKYAKKAYRCKNSNYKLKDKAVLLVGKIGCLRNKERLEKWGKNNTTQTGKIKIENYCKKYKLKKARQKYINEIKEFVDALAKIQAHQNKSKVLSHEDLQKYYNRYKKYMKKYPDFIGDLQKLGFKKALDKLILSQKDIKKYMK